MRVLDAAFAKNLIRMCEDGWRQGWHECHGGNLSYRLRAGECGEVREDLDFGAPWVELGAPVLGLAGDLFLLTGSGKSFRNTALDPENALGMIEINPQGGAYRPVWGFSRGGRPTSELPAHLINQEVKKRATRGEYRVIYHAHPENIIALSFILPASDEVFTRELWEMMPECAMIFPGGLGVIPWMVPGTDAIAELTGRKMGEYDAVLWAQHGLFTSGADTDGAFGLANTVEKAASMLLKVLAIGGGKRFVPSVQNFRDMAAEFQLDLPEKFLYEKRG